MDLKDLQAMGLVSANPLLERTIKVRFRPLLPASRWADPEVPERQEDYVDGTVTVYLRKLTAADQVTIAAAIQARRDYVYTLLQRCVFNEKGERVFPTEDDAAGVDVAMFSGLIEEINKLNGTAPKKSALRTSSGVTSASASGVVRLQSGSKP